mmetsp:Transcript_5541/g.15044  ORF Transcript_5541/g.15044 Transcript_5541/m.15044 type:complete len:105 (-) Transcript_5541:480-794(-)
MAHSTVAFAPTQTWPQSVAYFYTNFPTWFDNHCTLSNDMAQGESHTVVTSCMPNANIAIIDIFVSDPSFDQDLDNAVVPDYCYKPHGMNYPTVQFTFMIKCYDP